MRVAQVVLSSRASRWICFFLSFVLAVFAALLSSIPLSAQQPVASSPQAAALLQKSLAAQTGAQTLSDVTLTGTARRIAGSDDQSGTVVVKALANGSSRLDLSLSSGPRSEVRSASADGPAGSWSGPDAVSHPIAHHNLISEPAWFFPAIVLAQPLASAAAPAATGYVATYVGHETRNSAAVEHISISQKVSGTPKTVAFLQRLSQLELYLDSSTLLPAALTFNIHPDDNALLDIPIEIRYFDYRSLTGAPAGQIPFHIQKFLNNTLTLDLQFQSVSLNSGLPPSLFTVVSPPPPAASARASSSAVLR